MFDDFIFFNGIITVDPLAVQVLTNQQNEDFENVRILLLHQHGRLSSLTVTAIFPPSAD